MTIHPTTESPRFGSLAGLRESTSTVNERDMRRLWLLVLTGGLAALFVVACLLYYLSRPTVMTLAVGPGSDDLKLFSTFAAQLNRDRAAVRLRVISKPDPIEAAAALDDGSTDLAIVRRDLAMPKAGRAVAILRRNVVVIFALPGSKIEKVADLPGRRIGVVGRGALNLVPLDAVLQQYEIKPTAVRVVPVDPTEVAAAVHSGRVDAVLLTGPLTSRVMSDAVAAAAHDGKAPTFLEIDASEAIEERSKVYESSEIVSGAFGGNPARPPATVETISVAHYIVAQPELNEQVVAEFARLLFANRQNFAEEFPESRRIEAPSTDKDARVPVHPGAAAYFDGEQKTFFDRYGDLLYWAMILLSGLGSAVAGIAGYANNDDRRRKANLLTQLLQVVRSARAADSEDALDRLQANADEIFDATIGQVEKHRMDETGLLAFTLVHEQARLVIAERRAVVRSAAQA